MYTNPTFGVHAPRVGRRRAAVPNIRSSKNGTRSDDRPVTVIDVTWHGSGVLTLTYRVGVRLSLLSGRRFPFTESPKAGPHYQDSFDGRMDLEIALSDGQQCATSWAFDDQRERGHAQRVRQGSNAGVIALLLLNETGSPAALRLAPDTIGLSPVRVKDEAANLCLIRSLGLVPPWHPQHLVDHEAIVLSQAEEESDPSDLLTAARTAAVWLVIFVAGDMALRQLHTLSPSPSLRVASMARSLAVVLA
jgi:hypothetical protein